MPLLVNKIIFGLVPTRSPFILRPLVRYIFSTLDSVLVNPRLKVQAEFVRSLYLRSRCLLKRTSCDRPGQIEEHLSKCGDWLAGGQGPTSADFMMSFALEVWVDGSPDMLGSRIKEYVKRIHARYVPLVPTFFTLPDGILTAPQSGLSACKTRPSCTQLLPATDQDFDRH